MYESLTTRVVVGSFFVEFYLEPYSFWCLVRDVYASNSLDLCFDHNVLVVCWFEERGNHVVVILYYGKADRLSEPDE